MGAEDNSIMNSNMSSLDASRSIRQAMRIGQDPISSSSSTSEKINYYRSNSLNNTIFRWQEHDQHGEELSTHNRMMMHHNILRANPVFEEPSSETKQKEKCHDWSACNGRNPIITSQFLFDDEILMDDDHQDYLSASIPERDIFTENQMLNKEDQEEEREQDMENYSTVYSPYLSSEN